MSIAKPLVDLRSDIEQCAYYVYVNGGLVAADMSMGPAAREDPINHWLRPGENEITLHLYKKPEPERCQAKLGITIRDADSDHPAVTVLTLAYSGKGVSPGARTQGSSPAGTFDSRNGYRRSDRGDVVVSAPRSEALPDEIVAISRTFTLSVPFPEWKFFKGETMKRPWEIPTEQAMRPLHDEVLAGYRPLHAMLQKKDVAGFLDACEERSREMDLAYFKTPGATRAQLRTDLEAAVSDPAFTLKPLDKAHGNMWMYAVGSTGKVIGLTTGPRASPILRFKSEALDLIFPVAFRKEGGRLIVTR